MASKNKQLVRELHEKLTKEFMKQISESISIQESSAENKFEVHKNDSGSAAAIEETAPAPPPEEHSGPDKINEIRNEVAATQPVAPLNPNKQSQLMEIVKQSCEKFERELHRMVSEDQSTISSAAQKFKDESIDNARKKLTEKKYAYWLVGLKERLLRVDTFGYIRAG